LFFGFALLFVCGDEFRDLFAVGEAEAFGDVLSEEFRADLAFGLEHAELFEALCDHVVSGGAGAFEGTAEGVGRGVDGFGDAALFEAAEMEAFGCGGDFVGVDVFESALGSEVGEECLVKFRCEGV
jgi:hypothetical protein